MSDTSNSEEAGNRSRETRGCVLTALLVLWVLGTIALFPWARGIHLIGYPNLDGIMVSLVVLFIGVVFLILLYGILYAARDVLTWIARAIVVFIALFIFWLILAAVWKWLFVTS
jgi:hypothetical protein